MTTMSVTCEFDEIVNKLSQFQEFVLQLKISISFENICISFRDICNSFQDMLILFEDIRKTFHDICK